MSTGSITRDIVITDRKQARQLIRALEKAERCAKKESRKKKKLKVVSTEQAMADAVPFPWDDDVLSGKKKVVI